MKVYRCTTPRKGHRKEKYLGHWYAATPAEAEALALAYAEKTYGAPYTALIEAVISGATEKAFNADLFDHTKPAKP
jgi:hypothetical protein